MSLRATRKPEETWRDAVARIGAEHGLREDCLAAYDRHRQALHIDDAHAAWAALCDWDCLELVPHGKD